MKDKLRKLQLTQLEILEKIDTICRENNIQYSLYAGTLLGAARHQGFIPWDDDLDICMTRDNYERFLAIWDRVKPEGYILQNKENTPDFTQSFTKIRKEHTTFLQYDWEREKYHTGIFIDIFPFDKMPAKKLQRILFCWNVMQYQLYTREFVPEKSNSLVKFVSKLLLSINSKEKRKVKRKNLIKEITKYNLDKKLKVVSVETIGALKITFPNDIFDEYTTLQFENKKYMCVKDWKCFLECEFGDYMQLPPESERQWKHHPIILDFEKAYEELGE